MRKKFKLSVFAFAAALIMSSGLAVNTSAKAEKIEDSFLYKYVQEKNESADYKEGEAIVMFKQGTAKASITAAGLGSGIKIKDTYVFEGDKASAGAQSISDTSKDVVISIVQSDILTTDQLISTLSKRSDVEAVSRNMKLHITDNDYTAYQWALDNEGQDAGRVGVDVNPQAVKTLDSGDTTEKVVAIVDTGIDYTHPDLADKIWVNPFNNNKLKGLHGYDFANNDDDPIDDNDHGTHCAGIIAGKVGDNSGISGISDSDNIKLMALKMLDADGASYGSEMISCYNYIYRAQSLGVNVVAVNNSWGGGVAEGEEAEIFTALIDMVGEKGAVSVCAAGNSGEDNDLAVAFPAGLDSDYIISVVAANEKGELADFSCYGATSVDIAAPGTSILSSVCSYTYNPLIYSDAERTELCSAFDDYDTITNEAIVDCSDDIASLSYEAGKVNYMQELADGTTGSLTVSDSEYMGLAGGQSLCWNLTNVKPDVEYTLAIPVENQSAKVCASVDYKFVDNNEPEMGEVAFLFGSSVAGFFMGDLGESGEITQVGDAHAVGPGNYWSSPKFELSSAAKGKRVLVVKFLSAVSGNVSINLDNLSTSKTGADKTKFGKYAFFNGTSMATPYVTGAVAAVAQANPAATALERKADILGCARKYPKLKGKVATGGMLDMELLGKPSALVEDIIFDGEFVVIKGINFVGAEFAINDNLVTPEYIDANYAKLPAVSYANKRVSIKVIKNGDEEEFNMFLATGKSPVYSVGVDEPTNLFEYVSAPDTLFAVTDVGNVYSMDYSNGTLSEEWCYVVEQFTPGLFGNEYRTYIDSPMYFTSNTIYHNSSLWGIVKLDAGFTSECALVRSSYVGEWIKVCDIPEELSDYIGITLAAYNGNVMFFGGYDINADAYSKAAYSYNIKTDSLSKVADLPETRFAASAVQSGDTLVAVGGTKNGSTDTPQIMLYKNGEWKLSSKEMAFSRPTTEKIVLGGGVERELTYYEVNIGAIKDGVVIEGNAVDGIGSIVNYTVASDKLSKNAYISPSMIDGEPHNAVVLDGNLLILGSTSTMYWDEEFEEYYNVSCADIYKVPVKNSYISATYNGDDHILLGIVQGKYDISDYITIQVYPAENCFLKKCYVNGNSIKMNEEGFFVYNSPAYKLATTNLSVKATGGAYVSKLALKDTKIAQGAKKKLVAVVKPTDAANKKLTWKSSNKKVATVDENGLVVVNASAKVGSKVTITVTAADRNIISKKITVTVTKANYAKVGSEQTVNGIAYVVDKSSAKAKTVTATKFTAKAKAVVTIPDTIEINGYTYKVTKIADDFLSGNKKLQTLTIGKNVTAIGKNVARKCSALKNVTINATGVKAIGAGTFNNIAKSATVSVPKGKLAAYKALLKAAGCKASCKEIK